MRDRGARGVQRGRHVDRVKALPGFWVAVGDRLERERAGDIDEDVEPAEMRGRRVDGLQGLRRVGQIDAAEFDPVGRRAAFRVGIVDAGHSGAARDGGVRDHLAQCAGCSGDDDDFSVHEVLQEIAANAVNLSVR